MALNAISRVNYALLDRVYDRPLVVADGISKLNDDCKGDHRLSADLSRHIAVSMQDVSHIVSMTFFRLCDCEQIPCLARPRIISARHSRYY